MDSSPPLNPPSPADLPPNALECRGLPEAALVAATMQVVGALGDVIGPEWDQDGNHRGEVWEHEVKHGLLPLCPTS